MQVQNLRSQNLSSTALKGASALVVAFFVLPLGLAAQGLPTDLTPPSDFNGDGYADLAIGVYNEDFGGHRGAGVVHVLEGARGGIVSRDNQIWHKDVVGVRDAAGNGERFGAAMATGDFDGDGYADLAIGSPFERIGGADAAGSVSVLYGTRKGLKVDDLFPNELDDQFFHQDVSGVSDNPQTNDWFGAALHAADLDGDGYSDLVVGVPGEDVGTLTAGAGAIHIFWGSALGLTTAGQQFLYENLVVGLASEAGDLFGFSITSGDFNADGRGDIAVGVPGEDLIDERGNYVTDGGAVDVFYGTVGRISTSFVQQWYQGVRDVHPTSCCTGTFEHIQGKLESFDEFGFSLTSGDYNGDGFTDLAIGVPFEGIEAVTTHEIHHAGAVNVIYGFHEGLIILNNDMWHQNVRDIRGRAQRDDLFGYSITTGDFDNDGYDDLAAGVPHENVSRHIGAGAVNVIYGSRRGVHRNGNQIWHQAVRRTAEKAGPWEMFGQSVTAADFNGDGYDDLAVGVPGETLGEDIFQGGAVHMFYGRDGGIRLRGNRVWYQGNDGVIGTPENHDNFGSVVAAH